MTKVAGMSISELVSREHLREVIDDVQLEFGLAVTEEDFVALAFIHLGPDSELAKIRRAVSLLIDEGDS